MLILGNYHCTGFYSIFLYRRLYRCHTSLSSFAFDDGNVERKKVLTREEFDRECGGMEPVCFCESMLYGIDCAVNFLCYIPVIVFSFCLIAHFQNLELSMFTIRVMLTALCLLSTCTLIYTSVAAMFSFYLIKKFTSIR